MTALNVKTTNLKTTNLKTTTLKTIALETVSAEAATWDQTPSGLKEPASDCRRHTI